MSKDAPCVAFQADNVMQDASFDTRHLLTAFVGWRGCRVAAASYPAAALPDPDLEISTIRLFRGYVSRDLAP